MAGFFHYDNLTWPEVAELPRNVLLILPGGCQQLGIAGLKPPGLDKVSTSSTRRLDPTAQFVQVVSTSSTHRLRTGSPSRIYPTFML